MLKRVWFTVGVILCLIIGITYTVVTAQTQYRSLDLLSDPVEVRALPAGAEVRFDLTDPQLLANTHSVQLIFDMHGNCFLTAKEDTGRDASAFFFQSDYGWRYVNIAFLADLGFVNCHNGTQILTIPVSRFMDNDLTVSLDPTMKVTGYGFRVWSEVPDTTVTIEKVSLLTLPTC